MSGKTELLLFDQLSPQVVVENGFFVDVPPSHSIAENATTITFSIHGSEMDYLDLNDTLFYVQVKIFTSSGATLAADSPIRPVNFTLNALFSDVTLHLNDVMVEGGTHLYPYKATIENLFGFTHTTKKLQLAPAGYNKDNDIRLSWIKQSKSKLFVGALRLDFLNQPKYLLLGVNVRITLTKSKPKFALCGGGTTNPRLIIQDTKLYVRRVRVHDSVLKAHLTSLSHRNAIYPYTRGQVISYSIPVGSLSHFRDNLFNSSLLPKLVIVGFVRSSAFNGDNLNEEPFTFEPCNVSFLALYRDGMSLPYRDSYSPDFTNGMFEVDYFKSIIHNVQHLNTNLNNGISVDDFTKNCALFTFNLTPDFDMTQCQMSQDGNLRLEMKFSTPLTYAINVIVYGTFDTQIEITKDRQVICSQHVHH